MNAEEIKNNLLKVKQEINDAEIKSGREKGAVKLCAVSKFHPQQSLLDAIQAGQFLFGENRVQEAAEKFSNIDSLIADSSNKVELHIIGSLQSNKVKKAVEIASCIQSVDSEKLMQELEKNCAKLNRKIEVLLEIHTGEDSKSGFRDEDSVLKVLENSCKNLYPHLVVNGLMTMAPFVDDEKLIRKSFSCLREMAGKFKKEFPELPLKELSMGMSGDFKYAVEEGSTMVRIGTAIFGQRVY